MAIPSVKLPKIRILFFCSNSLNLDVYHVEGIHPANSTDEKHCEIMAPGMQKEINWNTEEWTK
jgi:hypothetical protein